MHTDQHCAICIDRIAQEDCGPQNPRTASHTAQRQRCGTLELVVRSCKWGTMHADVRARSRASTVVSLFLDMLRMSTGYPAHMYGDAQGQLTPRPLRILPGLLHSLAIGRLTPNLSPVKAPHPRPSTHPIAMAEGGGCDQQQAPRDRPCIAEHVPPRCRCQQPLRGRPPPPTPPPTHQCQRPLLG